MNFANLNPKQQQAVQSTEGPVLVLAGAGSGKTRALTCRIAYLIKEKRISPYNILAVTFTNKAAKEMAERVEYLLKNGKSNLLDNTLQDDRIMVSLSHGFMATCPNVRRDGRLYNRTAIKQRGYEAIQPLIGTFHSICARILRQEIELLGYKKSFTILDTSDQKKAIKLAIEELNFNNQDLALAKVLVYIEQAKNQLQTPQNYADAIDRASLFQTRIALIYERYHKYLKEMNYLDFGDLIMKVVEVWQKYPDILEKYQNKWHYLLVDEYQDTNYAQYVWCRLLAAKFQNIFVVGDDAQAIYGFRGADFRNILNFENDYPKTKVIFMEQNYRSTKSILDLSNMVICKNTYQKPKNLWTNNHKGFLPKIVEVEDESSEAQFILEVIAKQKFHIDKIDAPKLNVSINQEVYPQSLDLNQSSQKSGLADGRSILDRVLEQGRNKQQQHQNNRAISAVTDEFVYEYDLETNQSNHFSQKPDWADYLYNTNFQNLSLNNFVVLYRTNAQSRALEEQMLKFTVPYRLIGGLRFYERKEVKDVLAYLSLLINPYDRLSLERVINIPARGIGNKTLGKLILFAKNNKIDFLMSCLKIGENSQFNSIAGRLRSFVLPLLKIKDILFKLKVSSLIDLIGQEIGYFDWLKNTEENWEERIENINELKTVALKFDLERAGEQSLSAFLQETTLLSDIDDLDQSSNRALTLMTLHAVKGLEFPCVFIVGAEQGLLPHINSLGDKYHLEEERRLCYVGLTRAQKDLYLIYSRTRNLYGSTRYPQISEFIRDLEEEVVERVYL